MAKIVHAGLRSLTGMGALACASVAAALFSGCAGGPSDAEFVQACLNQTGVQMVKMTEPMCQCAAEYAGKHFDSKLQRVLVLNMQGKKQESEALVEGMSFDDRAKFAAQQFELVGQCLAPG